MAFSITVNQPTQATPLTPGSPMTVDITLIDVPALLAEAGAGSTLESVRCAWRTAPNMGTPYDGDVSTLSGFFGSATHLVGAATPQVGNDTLKFWPMVLTPRGSREVRYATAEEQGP